MGFKNYRKESRDKQWGQDQEENLTSDQINCGTLLRIADATELISKSYISLLDEIERFRLAYETERIENKILQHKIAGLKGWIRRIRSWS